MKTPQEIASELNKFYGSTTLYKHWLGLKYTEGIQYLAHQEVLRQDIEYTDFPLNHIKLYLVEKVLMLPNEY